MSDDLSRVAGGVSPELEEPLICECKPFGPPHPWEPGEWCSPERVPPADLAADLEAFNRRAFDEVGFPSDEWPFDDDPPDPL